MESDQHGVVIHPPPGDGPPYTLVVTGESGVAVEAVPVTAGGGEGTPPDGGEDPAAAMMPERRTERWRKPS